MKGSVGALLTWAEVNLDALTANVRALKQQVGPEVELFAVVKANAYGHGAAWVARAALAAGATRLAVHRVDEGVELRQAGITSPILILGYTPIAAAPTVATHRLTPTVTTLAFAQALSAQVHEPFPVHVKVDTGMGRHGLWPEDVVDFLRALHATPRLTIEGLFTHFATADAADQTHVGNWLCSVTF